MPSQWITLHQLNRIPLVEVVYVLYREKKAVYVGSTNNPYQRLFFHRKKGMPVDTVKISFERKYGESRMREIRLIAKLGPELNKVHRVGRGRPWIHRNYISGYPMPRGSQWMEAK